MSIVKKVVLGALVGLGATLVAHAYAPGSPATLTSVPQGFAECAIDGGVCKVPAGAMAYVVYGTNGKFFTSQGNGDFTCLPKGWVKNPSPATPQDLGVADPVPNVTKKCYLMVQHAAPAPPAAPQGGITIRHAIYGANCLGRGKPNPDIRGTDPTRHIATACNGKAECTYKIDHTQIGDPWFGCGKDYKVEYACPGLPPATAIATPEASGKTITLKCAPHAQQAPSPQQACLNDITSERYNFTNGLAAGMRANLIDPKEFGELQKVHNELIAMERKAAEDSQLTARECNAIHAKIVEENRKLAQALATRAAPMIKVQHAEYGANCAGKGKPNPDIKGTDPTRHIASACDGKSTCDYKVDHGVVGDPVFGCRKEYAVQYQCSTGQQKKAVVAAEASGQMARLDCTK